MEMNSFKKQRVFALLQGARMVMFSDSEEEEEYEGNNNLENYAEEIVPRMLDGQFKLHFRMNIETFQHICGYLATFGSHETRPEMGIEKQLMVTVWYLANAEAFRTVGSRFNLCRASCFRILYRTCKKLLKMNVVNRIIEWPSETEQHRISSGFPKFPGVIGAIDGCHFKILAPKQNHSSYINRKGYHSVVLQGICNDRKQFIDCYVGEVGSVHDASVWKRSPIYRNLSNGSKQIGHSLHLIGDSAYPLMEFLLTPFKNTGYLTDRQKKYNRCLATSRVRIENAFGILKSRFRRLKLIENRRIDFIVIIIMSCCILHNVCINFNDNIEEESVHLEEENSTPRNELAESSGSNKRQIICNSL